MKFALPIAALAAFSTLVYAQYQVPLQPVYNDKQQHTGYAMNVNIGTPGKTFSVLFETVTSKFWIPGFLCDLIHPFFVNKAQYWPLVSSTQQPKLTPWCQIHELKRFISTVQQWNDRVSIPLLDGEMMRLNDLVFGIPLFFSWIGWEQYQNIDGVFGFGPSDASGTSSPLQTFQAALSNAQTTIALPPLNSGNRPVLTFGGRDGRSCQLDTETNEQLVPAAKRYDFEVLSIEIDGTVLDLPAGTVAYPHTSSPYIIVPDQIMKLIAENLHAQRNPRTGKYMVDCKGHESFVLRSAAGNEYTVEPEYFVIKRNANDAQCELAFISRQDDSVASAALRNVTETIANGPFIPPQCKEMVFTALQNITASIEPGLSALTVPHDLSNSIALGLPFLHRYCTILQPNVGRISFARTF